MKENNNANGDIEMEVSYDVNISQELRDGSGNKSEELFLIEDFLKSDKRNICFTYESKEKAYSKLTSLRRTIKRRNLPVRIFKNENQVFVEKID